MNKIFDNIIPIILVIFIFIIIVFPLNSAMSEDNFFFGTKASIHSAEVDDKKNNRSIDDLWATVFVFGSFILIGGSYAIYRIVEIKREYGNY